MFNIYYMFFLHAILYYINSRSNDMNTLQVKNYLELRNYAIAEILNHFF